MSGDTTRIDDLPADVCPARRMAIAARGVGYGFLAGIACGAVAGMVLAFDGFSRPDAPAIGSTLRWAIVFAAWGGGYGAVVGPAVGAIGGVAFALTAPYLVRRRTATWLAGAGLAPGVLLITWIAWRTWAGYSLVPVSSGAHEVARVFVVGALLGGAAGARIAPWVLHGRRRAGDDEPRDAFPGP